MAENRLAHAGELGHSVGQGLGKVEFTAHRGLSHRPDLLLGAGMGRQHLNDLGGNERGVNIGDDRRRAGLRHRAGDERRIDRKRDRRAA